MAWGTIRNATDEDMEKLNKAARRFAAKHDLTAEAIGMIKAGMNGGEWYANVDMLVDMQVGMHRDPNDWEHRDAKYTAMLWKRCIRRALGSPDADGVAHGYVGYIAE